MSRDINEDYKKFRNYLNSYNLKTLVSKDKFGSHSKQIHKIYFCILVFQAEFNQQISDGLFSINTQSLEYINESISNLGSSVFNWIHGSYKTSLVMLRLTIENFVRGVGSTEDINLLTEEVVHKLFDQYKMLDLYLQDLNQKNSFDKVHHEYKNLCSFVHTNSALNMEEIISLTTFPEFNREKSNKSKETIVKLNKELLFLFCKIFNEVLHNMHYKNKMIVLESIPRSLKPFLMG